MSPVLYLYCQHSLGMGHLVRSIALARAMTTKFEVHLLSGGQEPEGFVAPKGVTVHHLPPLGMRESQLVSLVPGQSVEDVKSARIAAIDDVLSAHRPAVLVTELYPFGRKKFSFELDHLIDAVRGRGGLVVSSVRDLLVAARQDQQRHDDRAAAKLNAVFDAVIVHADPSIARLEETFRPSIRLETPVFYSGFVVPNPPTRPERQRQRRVIVSAGGGIVGALLFRTALDMHLQTYQQSGLPMTIVAGPFLPESDWIDLQNQAEAVAGLTLIRSTPDLCAMMSEATHSISQFGYNTAIDLMVAGVAPVVVPYAAGNETEQTVRAERFARAGALVVVPERELTPETLVQALSQAQASHSGPRFDLNGAAETTHILDSMLRTARPVGNMAEAAT